MWSVYVVCCIFLQTFQTYFCIQANSVDPDQTVPKGAVWSGSTLFAEVTFKVQQKTKKCFELNKFYIFLIFEEEYILVFWSTATKNKFLPVLME